MTSTPPCPAVHRPTVCAASLVLFIAFLAPARPAIAGWTADSTIGTPVNTVPGNLLNPIMVSDGTGGSITLWTDYRKGSADPDLYCQRVNAAGDTLWQAGGAVVCDVAGVQQLPTMISDGAGGAFIAWADQAYGSYALQHIGWNGVRRWAANGIHPVGGYDSQKAPLICRDTLGGVYLAFTSGNVGNPGTQLQRIDSLGVKRIGSFPPAEGASLHSNPSLALAIASDGLGGAIVVLGFNGDLSIQRVNQAGTLLWPAGGATVCTAAGTQNAADVVSDGAGGAIVAWADGRTTAGDIYAQRFSAAGAALWAADGVPLCAADTTQSMVQLERIADGSTVAMWRDYRHLPATSVYGQRIAPDGSFLWPADGARILSANLAIERFTLVAGGGDASIVAWNTMYYDGGNVFAQKVDGAATRLWGDYGVTVCRGPGEQVLSTAAGDGLGGVFVAYRDRRIPSDDNLYANHVVSGGQLGTVGVPWARSVEREWMFGAPNPARGAQVLSFARPMEAGARIEVLDILGRLRVHRALDGSATTWTWDGRDDAGSRVEPGVYLVRATSGGRTAYARVIRLD